MEIMTNGNIRIPQMKPQYEAREHRDFRALANYAALEYTNSDAFIIKTRKATKTSPAEYRHVTFREFRAEINWLGTAMKNRGWTGRRIALLGENCYEYVLAHFSILGGIGISVPLDKGLKEEETFSSLERSGAKVLIFDAKHLPLVRRLQEMNAPVEEYVCMNDHTADFLSIRELLEEGRRAFRAGDTDYTTLPIDPDETAIMVFTSGTTSRAKAVMLSQHNVLYNVYAMQRTTGIRRGDMNMAFLPYHHTYGSGGQTLMIACGASTAFPEGLKYIQKNMQEYHVSIFIGVPLLIEAMWKRIIRGIEKEGKIASFQKGVRLTRRMLKLHIDLRRRVFREIHEQLGGNLRFIFSGASALDPRIQRGWETIGVRVIQGYGMTESSPVITTEDPKNRRAGSIGKALYGVDLELTRPNRDGIGELIVRSPSVMLGYYEDPEETAKALENGWLHTGDLARIDEDGFVYLTGRSKNVIVLKNGKNVYPEELEALIQKIPYVTECLVTGEPRHRDGNHKDLAIKALIVYDPDRMADEAGPETAGLEASGSAGGAAGNTKGNPESPEARVKADIEAINRTLPNYKQILRLEVTDQPLEKTTTGKIKRQQKQQNH